jgi:superkiller protein 3
LYTEAAESGETALQLSADDAGNELSSEARQKCRLSVHLTMGMAHYYLGDYKEALEYFEPALEESSGNPDVVCLLAQVMWAQGDKASRSKARDNLFDCVEYHPEHVKSVLLLTVITLLDNDLESLEAVTSTLHDLRATHTLTEQEQGQVGEVLRSIAALKEVDNEHAVQYEVQTDVYLHPDHPHGWSRLADAGDSVNAAEFGLKTAVKAVPPYGKLDAFDISAASSKTGKAGDVQRAILLAPWRRSGWDALADVTCQLVS